MVVLDNSTRWNSTFLSLQRAILLKSRIQAFCLDDDYADELEKDLLSQEEWGQVGEITNGLKVFWQATKRVEGNAKHGSHGSIWEALPLIEALQEKLEDGLRHWNPEMLEKLLTTTATATSQQPKMSTKRASARAKNATQEVIEEPTGKVHPLAIAYQNAWQKLHKYYNLTDDAHEIYAAAVLFHPSFRRQYFDEHWTTDALLKWKEKMLNNVKVHYQKEYPQNEEQVLAERPKKKQREPDILDNFLRRGKKMSSTISPTDPFDTYINGEPTDFDEEDKDAVFTWWRTIGPPILQRRALDLLSIPAMSAEIERVFSSTKRLITADRNHLQPETIENLQLLKYWYQYNIVKERGTALEAVKRRILGRGDSEM